MAKVGINTGTSANAGDGSTLRAGANIINNNFDELYTALGDGTTLAPGIVTSIVAGSNISVTGTGQVTISSGLWEKTDAGINTVSNVGIGTTNPRFTLEVGAVGASGTSLYVNGDARVTGILTVGSSSVTLNGSTNEITVGTGITISGNTGIISATQVNIAGETLTGAGVTSLVAGSNITLSGSTGQVTISSAGGTWANYDSNTGISTTKKVKIENDLEVTGVSTFSGIGTSGALDVDGHTELDDVNVSGVSTFAGAAEFNGARVYVKSIIDVDGHTELDDVNVSGASTFSGAADFNGALDVDGHTELDDVNVSGASTFTGAADFNGAIDVDGHTELDDLNVSGVATVSTLKVGTAATINSSGLDVVGIASVGVAITMYASSGIVSATTYYGDGSQLSGVVSGITVEDEGSALSTLATTLDFVGSGVVASGTGATKTITISGGGGALASRTTKNATITSLAAGASGDLSITAFKAYNLLKIAINHPAWVRLYVNAASRTSDASRAEGTDPLPGSGVIAEVLTTTVGVSTFLMSPAVFGWNNDGTPATTVYAKVTNKDSSSRAITVTLTLIEAEA